MKKFANTHHATARLFILKSLFEEYKNSNKNVLILTDSKTDIDILKNFSKNFLDFPLHEVSLAGEAFAMENEEKKYSFAHTDIFRETGNVYHIQKSQSIYIERNTEISTEKIIENLLSGGYEFDPHLEHTFSYKKEWPIVSIIASEGYKKYSIEWFDTEIDSIIIHDILKNERKFVDSITLPKKIIQNTEKNNENPLNTELITWLEKITNNTDIFLIGTDFLEVTNLLQKNAIMHFAEIKTPESVDSGIENVEMENIVELLERIKNAEKNNTKIEFYTRLVPSVKNFLENNSLEHIKIHETKYRNLASFCIKEKNPFQIEKKLVIADDILAKIFVKDRKSGSIAKNLDLLISLQSGDYIVHRDHGIGLFVAIVKKKMGELEREYLEIHYAEGDKLFVPITEIFRISKYLGSDDVTLTRLGGKEWERTLRETDEELQKIAENILELNAKRKIALGRAFGKFPAEEQKFRDDFPYEYTADQYRGIMEVFADMEAEIPMDRLLSGDVGFGKTEIAMNAAYKAFLSGAQVAVISPLVVLAMEHYESFVERMEKFGVRIALFSRMNTPKEAEKILEKMKNGEVDVVIGTHRLLSEDVVWKKLGLLIVDEEHKFGVIHKEKIKKIRAGIDILALSATPIPRSLNMALSGLRQISLLGTPPKKKKPIETIITSWNENIIKNAIEFELKRGGQAIIVHNRIAGIESIQQEIEWLVDTYAKIVITHGRMSGDEIEDRIHDFKQKKYNILLTTTIIENGVNFLSANTIIIMDPETFGLASLHQLRGRVGRRGEQGYCYLAYRKIWLSDDEKERLITIANNNHLGAGFEIAMRDMEIRGAGDILGIKQSGKSKDVGLPLYFRMLEEKISELKDEKTKKIHTKIELELSYILSDDFFISELDKLNFFREAENLETLEDIESMEREFLSDSHDENIDNLFLLLRARIIFGEFQVEKISKNLNFYVLDFVKWYSIIDLKKFLDAFDLSKKMIVVTPEKIRIDARPYKNAREFLKDMLPK